MRNRQLEFNFSAKPTSEEIGRDLELLVRYGHSKVKWFCHKCQYRNSYLCFRCVMIALTFLP
jgi:hypothetical protein